MVCQLILFYYCLLLREPGAVPGFQVRGGGGCALKKIAPSGGRRENFWGMLYRYIMLGRGMLYRYIMLGRGMLYRYIMLGRGMLYRYIMLGRGICETYQSRDEKLWKGFFSFLV
jgi:hypothetical protein